MARVYDSDKIYEKIRSCRDLFVKKQEEADMQIKDYDKVLKGGKKK